MVSTNVYISHSLPGAPSTLKTISRPNYVVGVLGVLAAFLLAPISHVFLIGWLIGDNGPLERATDGSPLLFMLGILVWLFGWLPGVALCGFIIDRLGDINEEQKVYAVYLLPFLAGLIGVFAFDYDTLTSMLDLR